MCCDKQMCWRNRCLDSQYSSYWELHSRNKWDF
uniref:Uncharacterized protein n=1 Tax=Arundo donax TaxID=35708 RepID=A0A0A9AUA8_ARUDO